MNSPLSNATETKEAIIQTLAKKIPSMWWHTIFLKSNWMSLVMILNWQGIKKQETIKAIIHSSKVDVRTKEILDTIRISNIIMMMAVKAAMQILQKAVKITTKCLKPSILVFLINVTRSSYIKLLAIKDSLTPLMNKKLISLLISSMINNSSIV